MEPGSSSESTPLLSETEPTAFEIEHPETMSSDAFWKIGAFSGAAAVGLGAFGAHGLKKRIDDPAKLASWSTAAQYQVSNSLR
jgi:hypothetical protein